MDGIVSSLPPLLHFGNTCQPFILTVAGEKPCIITSPRDIGAVYRNTTTLTFDTFVRDLMADFGVSPSAVHRMFESPDKVRRGLQEPSPIPPPDCIGVHGRCFSKRQLQPGEMLDSVQSKVMQVLDENLNWETLSGPYLLRQTGKAKCLSLMKWCQQVIIEAGVRACYGDRLLEIEPDLLRTYIEFDEYSWMIFYKYPPIFARPMSVPREKIIQALRLITACRRSKEQDKLGISGLWKMNREIWV